VHAVQGGTGTHSGTCLTEDGDTGSVSVGMSGGTRSSSNLFVTGRAAVAAAVQGRPPGVALQNSFRYQFVAGC